MTYEEFLALLQKTPGATEAFQKAIAKATADAVAVAKADAEKATQASGELVAKVAPILSSAKYNDKVKALGVDVLLGKKSIEAFEAVVTVFEMNAEQENQEEAARENAPETPANGNPADPAKAEAEYKAIKDAARGRGI